MSHYLRYYDEQIGGGGGVKYVYSGSTYQRGRGVGSWLGGLFRKILPYIASGAKAVGKEAVRAGINVLDDVANNDTSFKESFKYRARESGKNLQRKASKKISEMMKGSGYKSRAARRRRQSRKTRSSSNIVRRKHSRRKRRTGGGGSGVTKRKRSKKTRKVARSVADIFGPRPV